MHGRAELRFLHLRRSLRVGRCGTPPRPLRARFNRRAALLAAVARVTPPTVWSHSLLMTVLADSYTYTLEFEQEIVESA
jgi:hypothetical protein